MKNLNLEIAKAFRSEELFPNVDLGVISNITDQDPAKLVQFYEEYSVKPGGFNFQRIEATLLHNIHQLDSLFGEGGARILFERIIKPMFENGQEWQAFVNVNVSDFSNVQLESIRENELGVAHAMVLNLIANKIGGGIINMSASGLLGLHKITQRYGEDSAIGISRKETGIKDQFAVLLAALDEGPDGQDYAHSYYSLMSEDQLKKVPFAMKVVEQNFDSCVKF